MDYPLLLGGREAGTLSESRSGLYTVFEARVPFDPGRLVRLYLHGAGESAYLGLMQPGSGGLTLRRRLSALERRAFPAEIAFASDEEGLHHAEPPPQTTLAACPWPAPVPEEDGGLLWMRCRDGSLRAFDGVSTLVALPSQLRRVRPGTVLREIEGRSYLVFRR